MDKIEGVVILFDKKGYFNYICVELFGVVVVIMLWNLLLMLLVWKIVLVLVVGCMVVVKLFEFMLVLMLEFVKLFEEVGFLLGVFNVVMGFGVDIGVVLVIYLKVKKVMFIGFDVIGCMIN